MKYTKQQEEVKHFLEFLDTRTGIKNLEFSNADVITDMQEEIERLNNIINEAKIYCEDVIQEHENGEYDVDTVWLAIKEHKGNIKSVLNILNGDLENYWRGDKD